MFFFTLSFLSPQWYTIQFSYNNGINQVKIDLIFMICLLFSFSFSSADYREHSINELANDSSAAILQMVPVVYRKFLTMKPRNQTSFSNNNNNKNNSNSTIEAYVRALRSSSAEEMLRNIARYNDLQSVLNEDLFGPLQNDSVIIVVQVKFPLFFYKQII